MATRLLDQPDRFSSLDPSGMLQKAMGFASQCQEARQAVKAHPLRLDFRGVRNVLVSGLGGSAIGGDILRTLCWKTAKASFSVNRHYQLPAWVSKDTVVICSSYSGNTEETLSAFQQALGKKCKLLAVASGGELLKRAQGKKVPFFRLPGGFPPRAAFGFSFFTLLTVMERSGLLPSYEGDFQETLEALTRQGRQWGPLTPTAKNQAKRLALFLNGKLPVIYAGQDHMESVGLRWKTQINENSKRIALFNILPEMNHNEVLGYSNPDPLLRKMAVVFLRHPQGDHPQIKRRFEILKGILKPKTSGIQEVQAEGKSLLAQMISTLHLADYVSIYLAYLGHTDPTPIGIIDRFKKELGR